MNEAGEDLTICSFTDVNVSVDALHVVSVQSLSTARNNTQMETVGLLVVLYSRQTFLS